MIDAVDELIEYRKQKGELSLELKRVHRFHRANPQVLDFLVSEMREARTNGWAKVSLGSLWHYSRWVLTRKNRVPGEHFAMSNNLFPIYGRIIAILHPDLNGFFEMENITAHAALGVTLERGNHLRGYVRRLTWADGTAIEKGWRPTVAHEPKPVRRRERVRRVA